MGFGQFSSSGGDTKFNWERPVKKVFAVGQVPGGKKLSEGIENILYAFIPATISLNSLPLKEVGDRFAPNLVGNINLNDETVVNDRRAIFVNDGSVLANPAGNSINVVAPAVDLAAGVNTTYRLEADVDNNGSPKTIVSPNRSLEAVYPFFWGVSSDGDLKGTALYGALSKSISKKGNKNVTYNGSNVFLYFCYPASYGNLSSILDPNNFEFLGDFIADTVHVSSTSLVNNWSNISYRRYKIGPTSVSSGLFQFKY